jgi:hypothetical protein
LSTSSRLMLVPFTVAHTSGDGWEVLLQPAKENRNTAARKTLAVRDETSRAAFGRIRFKGISSSGFLYASSSGLDHLAGADARSANAKMLVSPAHDSANALQVRVPTAAAGVIGVANHIAVLRPFAAKITLQCHVSSC